MVNILFSKYNFNDEWAIESVKKYINKNDKLCVIPFSFSEEWIANKEQYHDAYDKDGGKYYRDIVDPFIALGIDEDNIKVVNYYEDSKEKMKKTVKESDIVFLTGGLPDKAVERMIEKELIDSISKVKVVIGSSAGAVMQLKNYYLSPDDDYDEFNYYEGIGLINNDFYVEVHYENSAVQNECIERVLKEKDEAVYAITNNGGMIVDKGKIQLLGDVKLLRSHLAI